MTKALVVLFACLISSQAFAFAKETVRCGAVGNPTGPQLVVEYSLSDIYRHKVTLIKSGKEEIIAEVESVKDETKEHYGKFQIYTKRKFGTVTFDGDSLVSEKAGEVAATLRKVSLRIPGEKPQRFNCVVR